MRIGVAHPGTQHSWQVAYAFQERKILEWYATGFYYKKTCFPDNLIDRLPKSIKPRIEKQLNRRRFEHLDDSLIRRGSYTELVERQLGALLNKSFQDYLIERRHNNFPDFIEKVFSSKPVDILWGPHDSIKAIKNIKSKHSTVKYILDQPIGHFSVLNDIMREEYDKNPNYFISKPEFYSQKKIDSLSQALQLADEIMVGCDFAKGTLISEGVPSERIHIVEYGGGESLQSSNEMFDKTGSNKPINFIFVGTVEPRKGIAYLIDAFQHIDPKIAQLTLVGPKNVPDKVIYNLPPSVKYIGQVVRSEVNRYLDVADCFLFPSLFEGGGIVLYEAAGRGLPIIQSKNSAIVVEHEKTGSLLESPDCLAEEVQKLINDRNRLQLFQHEAKIKKYKRSWANYRNEISEFILKNS